MTKGKGTMPAFNRYGGGPPLVYIAGLDGTGELLFKQIPALAQSYSVITYRSREQGQFTYDDLTGDVRAIIQALGEQRATILGESFGGVVALAFALRFPQMVERLVIVNSFPRFRARVRIRLAAWLAPLVPFRATWFVRFAATSVGLYLDGVKGEDRRRFFKAIRTVTQQGYARRLQLISEADLEGCLSEIKLPSLFIAGDRDLLVPSVREAHAMARVMPDAQVRVIKGAAHACLLNSRVSLAAILDEWKSSQHNARP
jgi:pimeloyl-ACP methyl ester carboxylesterase